MSDRDDARWSGLSETLYLFLHLIGVSGTFIYQLFFNGFVYEGFNWFFHVGYSFLISQLWPLYWGWKGLLYLAQ